MGLGRVTTPTARSRLLPLLLYHSSIMQTEIEIGTRPGKSRKEEEEEEEYLLLGWLGWLTLKKSNFFLSFSFLLLSCSLLSLVRIFIWLYPTIRGRKSLPAWTFAAMVLSPSPPLLPTVPIRLKAELWFFDISRICIDSGIKGWAGWHLEVNSRRFNLTLLFSSDGLVDKQPNKPVKVMKRVSLLQCTSRTLLYYTNLLYTAK